MGAAAVFPSPNNIMAESVVRGVLQPVVRVAAGLTVKPSHLGESIAYVRKRTAADGITL